MNARRIKDGEDWNFNGRNRSHINGNNVMAKEMQLFLTKNKTYLSEFNNLYTSWWMDSILFIPRLKHSLCHTQRYVLPYRCTNCIEQGYNQDKTSSSEHYNDTATYFACTRNFNNSTQFSTSITGFIPLNDNLPNWRFSKGTKLSSISNLLLKFKRN